MTTLVDSNVILDVVTDDAEWGDWSASMLSGAAQQGRLAINPLIYAEVACGFDRIEDLEEALPSQYFTREPLPWAAAFLAARAFLFCRRRGGNRPTPLPDDQQLGRRVPVAGTPMMVDLFHDPRSAAAAKQNQYFKRWAQTLTHWEQRGPITLK